MRPLLTRRRPLSVEYGPARLAETGHVEVGLLPLSRTTLSKATNNVDASADFYDSLPRWGKPLDGANRQRIEKTVALVPPDVRTILDLGCGDGAISNELIARGMSIIGVDISTDALRYFDGEGTAASIDRLPFSDHSFDLVICAQVLEHLPEGIYEGALAEVERDAGKLVIITTPNEEYLPKHFVQCGHCGTIQHADLHCRVFDREAHRFLLPEFELVETVETCSWRQCPLMTSLRHRIFGYPKLQGGLTCPNCGHKAAESSTRRALWRIVSAAGQLLNWVACRSTARWIASLYRSRIPKQSACR